MLVRYNSVFVPLCSPNTCKDVFNPNVTAFQSNCAEGLHFSALERYTGEAKVRENSSSSYEAQNEDNCRGKGRGRDSHLKQKECEVEG